MFDWKKALVAFGLIGVGIVLYVFIPFWGSGSVLWNLFVGLHVVLSALFVFRNYSSKYVVLICLLLIIQVGLATVDADACSFSAKGGSFYNCDCQGLERHSISRTQCIGERSACYSFTGSEEIAWVEYSEAQQTLIECSLLDENILE